MSTTNIPTPATNEQNGTVTVTQVTNSLMERYHLPISPTYLTTFLSTTRQPLPPIAALVSTLHFRLLASDITQSLSSVCILPPNITDPKVKEHKLAWNTPMQVLDIIDIGTSKYSQLETLEMIERGEMIKGREIIRTVDVEGAGAESDSVMSTAARAATNPRTNASTSSSGPFKLLLQDAKGNKVYAFTVSPIPKISMPMPGDERSGPMHIGCKLVLKKGTTVRRGVVMVKQEDVNVLGGKVEAWDKQWRELGGRKKRLEEGMAPE